MTPFNHRPPGGYLEGVTMAALMPSLIGGLASTVLSSVFTEDEAPPASTPLPPAPAVEKVTPMPTPNDQDREAARKRSIAEQRKRQGRASTILTDDAEAKLGG